MLKIKKSAFLHSLQIREYIFSDIAFLICPQVCLKCNVLLEPYCILPGYRICLLHQLSREQYFVQNKSEGRERGVQRTSDRHTGCPTSNCIEKRANIPCMTTDDLKSFLDALTKFL